MLEIQEKFDNTGYEELVESASPQNLHITEALDGGAPIGFIAYWYGADKTTVCAFDDGGDLMLCDGLVRSVMFKSVLKGIEVMEFALSDTAGFENLRKLRFLTGDSRICEDLNSFMNGCESCKENKKDN
ncbi:MAG: hypothetical protein IJ170_07195 [Ruminococcus sp.]|nr:hypothetical protein [Ruminococcus sp.]